MMMMMCVYMPLCVCICVSVCLYVSVCTEIDVKYSHGFVSLSVPLPSRRERCLFTFLPATQTIADLVSQLKHEDKGTDHVTVYSKGTTWCIIMGLRVRHGVSLGIGRLSVTVET